MDSVSGFFVTAPGWIWIPMIAYAAISLAWAFYKVGGPDFPVYDDEAALFVFALYLAIGVFWPAALMWKIIKRGRTLKTPAR